MDKWIVVILIFFALLIYNDVITRKNYSVLKEQKERISWFMHNGTDSLLYWIYDLAKSKEFDFKKYQIVDTYDIETAGIIINAYKRYMVGLFFSDSLNPVPKYANKEAKRFMSDKEYFAQTLYSFMTKNITEQRFGDNPMYLLESETVFGRWGGQLFDARYALTDFAIVYHKLYYALEVALDKTPQSNKYIDSGFMNVSCF